MEHMQTQTIIDNVGHTVWHQDFHKTVQKLVNWAAKQGFQTKGLASALRYVLQVTMATRAYATKTNARAFLQQFLVMTFRACAFQSARTAASETFRPASV